MSESKQAYGVWGSILTIRPLVFYLIISMVKAFQALTLTCILNGHMITCPIIFAPLVLHDWFEIKGAGT